MSVLYCNDCSTTKGISMFPECQKNGYIIPRCRECQEKQDLLYKQFEKEDLKRNATRYLFDACVNLDLDSIRKYILVDGVNLNEQFSYAALSCEKKYTSFHIACYRRDICMLKLLSTCDYYHEFIFDIEGNRNSDGMNCMDICIKLNFVEGIKFLIEKYWDKINFHSFNGEKSSYIHIFCQKRWIDIINLLYKKNPAIVFDFPDENNNYPMHYACENDDVEMVKRLMELGCSPVIGGREGECFHPLLWCILNNRERCLRVMIDGMCINSLKYVMKSGSIELLTPLNLIKLHMKDIELYDLVMKKINE